MMFILEKILLKCQKPILQRPVEAIVHVRVDVGVHVEVNVPAASAIAVRTVLEVTAKESVCVCAAVVAKKSSNEQLDSHLPYIMHEVTIFLVYRK